jgi:WD40 repeat protein
MSSGNGAGGTSTSGAAASRRGRLSGVALAAAALAGACGAERFDPSLPPAEPAALSFPGGPARLVGGPLSSCSAPASDGERWCAFAVEAAAERAATLWVARLAPGAPPRCDAGGADCLELTSRLWTGHPAAGPAHPYSHRFDGDTLIFYADAASGPDEIYRGPVYAWRPGWSQGRKIAGGVAVLCTGHPRFPLVHCVEDPAGGEGLRISAGRLVDRADLKLASLGRFSPAGAELAWQASFSPDGNFFVFSRPDPTPGVETLHLVATAELGRAAPRAIIRDATFWDFSADGRRLFFLRRSAGGGDGDLYEADFPSGNPVARLAAGADGVAVFGADSE